MSAGVENPYFEAVAGGVTVGGTRGLISDRGVEVSRRRDELVERYGWAIPNIVAIEAILANEPILEVGAGVGYWAWCIRQLDETAIAATDIDPPENRWTHVVRWDATDAIRWFNIHYPEAALLLIWPPYDDPMAGDALAAYAGETVIYVGEGRGGCTADEAFHRRLHRDFELDETVAIPTYLGINDRLEIWRRAASPGGCRA